MRQLNKPMYLFLSLVLALLLGASAATAMESADCLACHSDASMVGDAFAINEGQFDTTAHAEMGCSGCHESVTDAHPDDGLAPSKASCKDCHDDIHKEYTTSVHGSAASCADCHNPHEVKSATEVAGFDMNRQCATCHEPEEMTELHDQWLPQAGLHIEALPCVTCHTGSENYVITMYLLQREAKNRYSSFVPASQEDLAKLAGDKPVQTLLDADSNGEISLAELRAFNGDPKYQGLRLWGMMTPEKVTHTFQILDNRWDCSFCHASGPQAMQTSYVAFPEQDGSYARLAVEKGAVLDVLNGTPDFYMMGATRSKWLNIAGLLIILGGLVMPVGHGTLRFLTRKNREGKGH